MVALDSRALRGAIELHTGVPGDALAILLQAGREAAGVSEFLAMSGYGFYVWGSYGMAAVCIAIEIWMLNR